MSVATSPSLARRLHNARALRAVCPEKSCPGLCSRGRSSFVPIPWGASEGLDDVRYSLTHSARADSRLVNWVHIGGREQKIWRQREGSRALQAVKGLRWLPAAKLSLPLHSHLTVERSASWRERRSCPATVTLTTGSCFVLPRGLLQGLVGLPTPAWVYEDIRLGGDAHRSARFQYAHTGNGGATQESALNSTWDRQDREDARDDPAQQPSRQAPQDLQDADRSG